MEGSQRDVQQLPFLAPKVDDSVYQRTFVMGWGGEPPPPHPSPHLSKILASAGMDDAKRSTCHLDVDKCSLVIPKQGWDSGRTGFWEDQFKNLLDISGKSRTRQMPATPSMEIRDPPRKLGIRQNSGTLRMVSSLVFL